MTVIVVTGWTAYNHPVSVRRVAPTLAEAFEAAERSADAMELTKFSSVHFHVRSERGVK